MTIGTAGHSDQERVGATQKIAPGHGRKISRFRCKRRLILRGEGYVGSNLITFDGGIEQGVYVAPNIAAPGPFTTIKPIGDVGGWAELTVLATKDNKNIFYVGAGTDDPENSDLLASATRQKNTFYWATYFRKLVSDVTLGVELSNWQFRTVSFTGAGAETKGPYARSNFARKRFVGVRVVGRGQQTPENLGSRTGGRRSGVAAALLLHSEL